MIAAAIPHSRMACAQQALGRRNSRRIENGDELSHAAGDPLVDLLEDLAAVIHRVMNRAGLDGSGIEVTQDEDVGRPAPETFTNQTLLCGVHRHDKIGGAN